MATTVRMLGWSARGLRCPDYSISFENGDGKVNPVSLIQMPNGTGKTTTLSLLRATLSGAAEKEKWDSDKVRSFQKKLNPESTGEFQVALSSNGRRVTITLLFNFDEGTVRYTTTLGSGKETGFKPPRECRDFFDTGFINFFVFNGELAQQLLNPQFANAERAIEFLYKLKHFTAIKKAVDEHWHKVVEAASASSPKALTQRQNRVNALITRIETLKQEKRKTETTFRKAKSELVDLKDRYEEKIHERDYQGQDYEEKKTLFNATVKEVENLAQALVKRIRSPHLLSSTFGRDVITLKRNLDKVKLPESTAREFFQELAEELECVCGRPLDEEHRNNISPRERILLEFSQGK